jgi:hypothetical protein
MAWGIDRHEQGAPRRSRPAAGAAEPVRALGAAAYE